MPKAGARFRPSDPDDGLSDLLGKKDFRCTVHIEDVLFKDTLYQLLEYFPAPGGPAGRRFSVRFGMMGLAWRTKTHQGHGDAAATKHEDLVRYWGMTEDEARRRSRQRASYLCVMLETATGDPTGILFMDADEKYAFGDQDHIRELACRICAKSKTVGFQDGLEKVVEELRKYRAGVEIHG